MAIKRPVKKILNWYNDSLIVLGNNGESTNQPRKGGIDKSITKVTEEQYEKIDRQYSGWNLIFHANQIITQLENETIDLDLENNLLKLKELVKCINEKIEC